MSQCSEWPTWWLPLTFPLLTHSAQDCRAAAKRHTAKVLWEQYTFLSEEVCMVNVWVLLRIHWSLQVKLHENKVGFRHHCSQLKKQAATARDQALAADQVTAVLSLPKLETDILFSWARWLQRG